MLNRFPFLWFENFTYGRNWPILEPISTDFHQYWPKCLKKMVILTLGSIDSTSANSKNSPMLKITNFETHSHQFWPILTEMLAKNGHLTLGSIDSIFSDSQISPCVKLTNFGTHYHQFWPIWTRNASKNDHFDNVLNRFHFFWFENFTHGRIDQFWNPFPPISTNIDANCLKKWSFWHCAQSIPFFSTGKFHR